jgi:nuclear transport factor 2 (NTF2) superfamily protein
MPALTTSTTASPPPMSLVPPFTLATATRKVKLAQALWNLRDPARVAKAYTDDSVWRNRSDFVKGHAEIEAFLTKKWEREIDYKLRKEVCPPAAPPIFAGRRQLTLEPRFDQLFAFEGNRIAVQFWYEARVGDDWFRTYGLEHWCVLSAALYRPSLRPRPAC